MKLSYLSALVLVPAFILTGLHGGGYQLYHTIRNTPKAWGVCQFIPASINIPATITEGNWQSSSIICDGKNIVVGVGLMPAGTKPPEGAAYYEDPKALILFGI